MSKCDADGGWAHEVCVEAAGEQRGRSCDADENWGRDLPVESDGGHDRGLRGAAFLHATIDMGESWGDMSHMRNGEARERVTIVLRPKTAHGRVARLVG